MPHEIRIRAYRPVVSACFAVLFASGCERSRVPEPLPPEPVFRDGFENARDVSDLFPANGSGWMGLQQQPAGNILEVSGERSHSGGQSLRFVALPASPGVPSKCDIYLDGLHLGEGSTAWFEWWVWLSEWNETRDIFLWDLEAPGTCTDETLCPDEGSATICPSPGRRVFVGGGERRELMSDLGKWCRGDIARQDSSRARVFPVAQWVRIRVRIALSSEGTGRIEVWQNDHRVLDARGITLPRRDSTCTRMQIGITTNRNEVSSNELFVDDVSVWLDDPGW